MVQKVRFLLVAVAVCGAVALQAALFCRSGEVVKSAIERKEVEIQQLDKALLPEGRGPFRDVVVTIRPDEGRKISTLDYELVVKNVNYTCLAIAVGDGPFEASGNAVADFGADGTVRLVFRVPSKDLGYRPKATLKYMLARTGALETELDF